MAKSRKVNRRLIAVLAIIWIAVATVVLAPTASASADRGDHLDYGRLTAQWWQWIFAQETKDIGETNSNPIFDSTGDFAAAGQAKGIGPARKFFFLAGGFGGEFVRTVTVPRGKMLFFPIFNFEADNASDPPTTLTVPELREKARKTIDGAGRLWATFDDSPVDIFRATSPVFSYTVPKENSIYDYFGLTGDQFTGRIKPVVSDGYWAVVPPPSPGQHTLRFHSDASGFTLDVTYNLTIARTTRG